MKYYFIALNNEGKKISGEMEVADEAELRQHLRQDHLAVVSVSKTPYETTEEDNREIDDSEKYSFEFQGKNNQDKQFSGTIHSISMYDAYRKLRRDYHLTLDFLIPSDVTEAEKTKLKMTGVPKEIVDIYDRDEAIVNKQDVKKIEVHELNAAAGKFEEKRKFMESEINELIPAIQAMLDQNKDYIDPDKKYAIQNRLNSLARLKKSNAIVNLKNIVDSVLLELQNDKLFLENCELTEEEKTHRLVYIENFTKKFNKALIGGLAKLGGLTFDADEIIESIQQLRPFDRLMSFLFWTSAMIFLCSTSFVIFANFFSSGQTAEWIDFYSFNVAFWGSSIFSLLFCIMFGLMMIFRRFRWVWEFVIFFSGLFFLSVIVILFPLLFPWLN